MIQKNIKTLYFFQLAVLFLLPGCSQNNNIDEDKFVKVYTDILVAQDTLKAAVYNFDSLKTAVFKRYGITGKDYNSTIDYYNKDPQRWEKFFNKVTEYVEKLRDNSIPKGRKNLPAQKSD